MKDYMIRGVDKNQRMRLAIVTGRDTVEDGRKAHHLSPTATAALGRSLMGGLLMAAGMKNEKDSLTLHVDGNGPLGKILVTAKNDGKIKGYVGNPFADAPLRQDGKMDVGAIVGRQGTMTVVMDQGLKEPYQGTTPLANGEIGEDLAHYFVQSEQIPSAVGLGVLVDRDRSVIAAGGFLLQLLPEAGEEDIQRLEAVLGDLPSVSDYFSQGKTPEDLFELILPEGEILEKREVRYHCDCSWEKVENSLIGLGEETLREIKEEDHGAEVRCYFCNKTYDFSEEDLERAIVKGKEEE